MLALLWGLLCLINLKANEPWYRIRQLDNLPQNDVSCIYRDSKGFVWIGTLDGLHRYDGYAYKTYRIDEDKNSISSNMVIAVDEDSQGHIWIGTYGKGICMLNPENDRFIRYSTTSDSLHRLPSDDVTCMIVDSKDVIWMGNWYGAYRIWPNQNSYTLKEVVTLPLGELSDSSGLFEIKTIHEDQSHVLWIGSNLNLIRVSNPHSSVENLDFHADPNNSEVLCNYPSGILVGGQQLISYSTHLTATNWESSRNVISNIRSSALLYLDSALWVGNRSGLQFFHWTGTEWAYKGSYKKDDLENGLASNIITTIISDHTGKLWIGTRGGGVSTIRLNPKKIEHYKHTIQAGSIADNLIRCIYEDSDKNLWIGSEEGGISLLRSSKANAYQNGFQHLTVSDNINGNRVYCIGEMKTPKAKQQSSLLWMGTSYPTHLVAMDPKTLRVKKQPQWIDRIGFVYAIAIQNDSTLWVGTYGEGLWRFHVNAEGDIVRYRHFSREIQPNCQLSSSIIRSLLFDSKGCLWIGTDKGLNRIHPKELDSKMPSFQVFEMGEKPENLDFDYILQVFEDRHKKIWIGTMGGGLLEFKEDPSSENWSFTPVTTKNGLPNNSIKSILEDHQGNLWLSSNRGLSRFDPHSRSIVNYDIEDGLQDNEFSEICACKRANGQLLFGGINGFNAFYPEEIERDTIKPKLFFTDFYILNQLVHPGDIINKRVVLEKTIEYTKTIRLKYKENSFSIGFVALQLNAPQKNNYQYQLEGFDKQWYSASSSHRMAKYTNIPSGKYIFKVNGSNCDNIWADQPIQITIRIAPPPYRNIWAISGYSVLVSLLLFSLNKMYRFNMARKQELLISKIEKENIESVSLMKLQFFTNISHEFRTPLTLIDAPLERLIQLNKSLSQNERMQNYRLIRQNVNVMLRLINQLMDFRRLERDKMKLNARFRELNSFVQAIYQSFEPWAHKKEIQFDFKPNFHALNMWFDPDKIEKVLYNLLSNAIKFTPRHGRVELLIIKDDLTNSAVVSVKDTGVGIAEDEQEHIFERYYQPSKKYTQSFGGTGIGLALSKGLVEIHHGSIQFSSTKGEGSTFTVSLPLGDAHLLPEEKIIDDPATLQEITTPIISDGVPAIEADEYLKSNHQRFHLLIVEDNIDLLHFMVGYFENYFQVHSAENGRIALDMCKEIVPDIIVSDVMMPEMDGIDFCEKIRENEELSHIPIILLTAKNTNASQIEGFKTGADAYLMKPFNAEVLKARIVSLIKNRLQLRMKFEKEVHIHPDTVGNTPSDTRFLEGIIHLIEKNLSDSGFNVEKLADQYGVSRIYINRKIKAITGETSNHFIRNIRLKRAAELLRQNELTISEITWQVGYTDLRTFRSRFKEKFGVSPSEYSKDQASSSEPLE